MTLPRYVVNMEEGLPYIIPQLTGENGEEYNFERGYQRSKGLRMRVSNGYGTVSWTVDRPIFITGIKIATDYGDQRYPHKRYEDTLDFIIGDKKIYENKPIVRQENYVNHRVFQPVDVGVSLSFRYKNNTQVGDIDEDKWVWVDIDYIADMVLQYVIFQGIDEDGELLYEKEAYLSKGEYTIPTSKYQNYTPNNTYEHFEVYPKYKDELNDEPVIIEIKYREGV